MVAILPPPTSLGAEIGQGVGQGIKRGAEQGFQRNQIQQALGQLDNIPKDASAFDVTRQLISAFAGIPGGEKYVSSILPFVLQQAQYGGGGAAGGIGGGMPAPGGAEGPAMASPERPKSILYTRTPQQIEQEATRFAQLGGDYSKRFSELNAANDLALKNQTILYDLATKAGISQTRIPELYEFALSHPEINNPAQLVSTAKREFEKAEKFDVPGFWARILGSKDRQQSVKDLNNYYKTMKDLGREQEARTTLAEKGLTQTEMGYAAHPLAASTEKSLKELPDGPLKEKSLKEVVKSERERQNKGERDILQSRAQASEKESEDLTKFFADNVNEDSSLLVLRDQLYRKGYDWRQIKDSFEAAYPDPAKQLSPEQNAEIIEMSQAPIPFLGEIFNSWRRFGKFFQGAR